MTIGTSTIFRIRIILALGLSVTSRNLKSLIFVLAALSTLTGCSQMVANSGIPALNELRPVGLSRLEVQDRYGTPLSSSLSSIGRKIEIYRLRKQLETVFCAMCNHGREFVPRLDSQELKRHGLLCLLLGPVCLYAVGNEIFSFPVNVVRSQMNQVEVAFVYGNDDRVLYAYEIGTEPSTRFSHALHSMQHPLLTETDSQECRTVTRCLKEYIREKRRRAEEVGHTLNEEDEDSFNAELKIAEDIDQGKITKEEGKNRWLVPNVGGESARLLYSLIHPATDSLLNRIKQGECNNLVTCISEYQKEIQAHAASVSYTLNSDEEKSLELEVDIAREYDDGKITRDAAYDRLFEASTRRLLNLYRRAMDVSERFSNDYSRDFMALMKYLIPAVLLLLVLNSWTQSTTVQKNWDTNSGQSNSGQPNSRLAQHKHNPATPHVADRVTSIIGSILFPGDDYAPELESEIEKIPTDILLEPFLVNQIEDKEAAKEIVVALARRPFGETESFFSSYLAQDNLDPEIRIAVLEALGDAAGDSSRLLLRYLADDDPETRAAAAWGLANLEGPGQIATQLLKHLDNEKDADIRAYINIALEKQRSIQ